MEPPPPSMFSKQTIEPELDAIVLKGLMKGATERYQTARDFKQTLDRYIAKLRCPPGLRDTTLAAGLLRDAGEPEVSFPLVSKSVPSSSSNVTSFVWGAMILFLFGGAVAAAVMLWFAGGQ
jgi:hypothetical protein